MKDKCIEVFSLHNLKPMNRTLKCILVIVCIANALKNLFRNLLICTNAFSQFHHHDDNEFRFFGDNI